MRPVFLKIVAGIFLVLLAVAAFPMVLSHFGQNSRMTSQGSSVDFSGFRDDSVSRISYSQNGRQEVVLDRASDIWKIGADEADKEKVSGFFLALSEMRILDMASKNESNFGKLGVDQGSAIKLSLRRTDGNEKVFFIGKASDVPGVFFLRKDGVKNTYSARGALRELLSKDASYWKRAEATGVSGASKK